MISYTLAKKAREFIRKVTSHIGSIPLAECDDPRYVAPAPQPIWQGSGRYKTLVGYLPDPPVPQVSKANEEALLAAFRKLPPEILTPLRAEATELVLEVYYADGGDYNVLHRDWWGVNMERMEVVCVLARCRTKELYQETVEVISAISSIYGQKNTQLNWKDGLVEVHKQIYELNRQPVYLDDF